MISYLPVRTLIKEGLISFSEIDLTSVDVTWDTNDDGYEKEEEEISGYEDMLQHIYRRSLKSSGQSSPVSVMISSIITGYDEYGF